MKEIIVKSLNTVGAIVAVLAGVLAWSAAKNAQLAASATADPEFLDKINTLALSLNVNAAVLTASAAFLIAVANMLSD